MIFHLEIVLLIIIIIQAITLINLSRMMIFIFLKNSISCSKNVPYRDILKSTEFLSNDYKSV